MFAITDDFKHELIRPHRICTLCEIIDRNGMSRGHLFPISGQVGASDDAVRRRGEVRLLDVYGSITPDSVDDIFTPYGTEFRLFRGIRLPGGTDYRDVNGFPAYTRNEFIPLGVFRMDTFESYDSGEGYQLYLTGFDRAWEIGRRRFTAAYGVAKGTNYGDAIRAVVASRGLSLTFNFAPTGETTPKLVFDVGEDPWEQAQTMAKACGMEIYFDVQGVCVMRPIPDPLSDPTIWNYTEGRDSTILYVDRSLSTKDAPNHIIAIGATADGDPVRGDAQDSDPSSATYVAGPYGNIPEVISSPMITSTSMAQNAASAELRNRLGAVEQVNIEVIPNPAHEIHDIIAIKRGASKINFAYAITSFTVSLEPTQAMPISIQRRQPT